MGRILSWVIDHKTEVMELGSTLLSTILTSIFVSDGKPYYADGALQDTASAASCTPISVKENVGRHTVNNGEPFTVRTHLRNMSGDRHASDEHVQLARSIGISLEENQTIVQGYTKNIA